MADMDDSAPACALTINDINTTVNGEPRIHDLRLSEAFGFTQPRDIRKLIARHLETLKRLRVCPERLFLGRNPCETTHHQADHGETEKSQGRSGQALEVFR